MITFYHFLGNPWATDCRIGLLRYYQQEQYRQEAIKGSKHCWTVVFVIAFETKLPLLGLEMTFTFLFSCLGSTLVTIKLIY